MPCEGCGHRYDNCRCDSTPGDDIAEDMRFGFHVIDIDQEDDEHGSS